MKWRYQVQRVGDPRTVTVRHKPHRHGCAATKALPALKEAGVKLGRGAMLRVEAGNRVVTHFEINRRGNVMPLYWR